MKNRSSALNLLEFLENDPNTRIPFVFRKVATSEEFIYYIGHLDYDSYKSYNIVYLCFHGSDNTIGFADKNLMNLTDLATDFAGMFKGKNVHFGSCSTLNISEDEIKEFKRISGARMVSGYKDDVDCVDAFIFELWLLNTIDKYPEYAGKRIKALAEKQMPYYCNELQFIAI